MVRRWMCVVCAVFFMCSLVCFSACKKRVAEEEGLADQGKKPTGMEEGDLGGEKEAGLQKRGVLANIYFAFDDYSLSGQAKKTLADNAAWLAQNSQSRLYLRGIVMKGEQRSTTSRWEKDAQVLLKSI